MPEDCRRTNIFLIFKRGQEGGPTKLQAKQLHLQPWEGDGATNSGIHFQAYEQESNQEQSAQTHQIALHNETTGLVDEGRAVDTVCLDFSKGF